jgi:hypothetical protein
MHTKQQIEQWAVASGMIEAGEELPPFDLSRFAELVAQHERERAAKICEQAIREEVVWHSPPMFVNCTVVKNEPACPMHAAAIRSSP